MTTQTQTPVIWAVSEVVSVDGHTETVPWVIWYPNPEAALVEVRKDLKQREEDDKEILGPDESYELEIETEKNCTTARCDEIGVFWTIQRLYTAEEAKVEFAYLTEARNAL